MTVTIDRDLTCQHVLAAWVPCTVACHGVKRYVPEVGMVRRLGTGTPIPMGVDLLSPFDAERQAAIAAEVRAELEQAYAAIATRHPWVRRVRHTAEGGLVTVPADQPVPLEATMSLVPVADVAPRTRVVCMYRTVVVADETFATMRQADRFIRWFRTHAGIDVVGGATLLRADKPDPFVGTPRALVSGARRTFGAWCRAQIALAQSA